MFDGLCLCPGDYEPADVFSTKLVKARKEHRCVECSRVIPVGYTHERVNILYEGQWSTYRTCRLCVAVAADFFSPECGRMVCGLWEMIQYVASHEDMCGCEDDCDCMSIFDAPTHPIQPDKASS